MSDESNKIHYRKLKEEEFCLDYASIVSSKGQIRLIKDGEIVVSVDAIYDFGKIPEWAHGAVLSCINSLTLSLVLLSEQDLAERHKVSAKAQEEWRQYSESTWIRKALWIILHGKPIQPVE